MILALALTALAGGVGGWLWGSRSTAPTDKAAIEQVVRDYLLEHPEILPEAMQRLQQREAQKQLASAGDDLEKAFPGAVLGNPAGSVSPPPSRAKWSRA